MIFNLKDFEHIREDKTVQFKEEIVDGVSITTICYMVSNDKLWNIPLGRECRGHSFNTSTGELVSLAYNKFFNIFEKEETQPNNINWNDNFEITAKVDGSLITFALINDKVYAKTKKSFYSDVAILANKYLPENIYSFVKECLINKQSPIFEFTHPEWKIVVDYGEEPTWKLLSIRDMVTGEYFDKVSLTAFSMSLDSPNKNIPLVDFYEFKNHEEIKASVDTMVDAEGFVIYFPNIGLRIKTKCNWYNLRHILNTDLRERDVAKMVADETLDDIKAIAIEAKFDINKIQNIENRVVENFSYIKCMIDNMVDSISTYATKKDAAISLSNDKWFSFAVREMSGREIDYRKIWYDTYLQDYSLKTIYSNFNKAVEEEAQYE